MNSLRSEYLSQISPDNSHIDYEQWLENKITNNESKLRELEDAVAELWQAEGKLSTLRIYLKARKNSQARARR